MKLTIEGEWWDSYVYSSVLYLVREDGSALVVPWARLVDSLVTSRGLDSLAAELAFVDARYLYGSHWARLVRDAEIATVLGNKFDRLAAEDLVVTASDIRRAGGSEAGVVGPELLADIEMHRSIMYFAAEDGLWAQHRARIHASEPAERVWDPKVLSVRASRGLIAMAAGDEGLFQAPALASRPRSFSDDTPLVLGNFFSCAWVSTNIYATSYENVGTLALFSEHRSRRDRVLRRRFETAIPGEAVFEPGGWSADWEFSEPADTRPDGSVNTDAEDRHPEDASKAPAPQPEDAEFEPWGDEIEFSDEDQEGFTDVIFERSGPPPHAPERRNGLSWGGESHICITSDRGGASRSIPLGHETIENGSRQLPTEISI